MSEKKDEILIGAHLSMKNGFSKVHKNMIEIGGTCCAFFLKNQKQFVGKKLEDKECDSFKQSFPEREKIVVHGSYLVNMANTSENKQKHFDCLLDELERARRMDIKMVNFHPGSDVNKHGKNVFQKVADSINLAFSKVENVCILLENMAGQGRVIGGKLDDLRKIMDLVQDRQRVGVCIDTAHLHGAGYDIRTLDQYENVISQIERIIGMKNVHAMHINDSKVSLGSKKDRHEKIGEGKIGIEAFKFIMRDGRFRDIPKILETPNVELYAKEIKMLTEFAKSEY